MVKRAEGKERRRWRKRKSNEKRGRVGVAKEGQGRQRERVETGEGKERKSLARATRGNYRRRGCRPLLVLPAWTFTAACLEDGVRLKQGEKEGCMYT